MKNNMMQFIIPSLLTVLIICIWCLVESLAAEKKVKARIEEQMDDTERFYHT